MLAGKPRWLLLSIGAVVVLLLTIIVVSTRGGGRDNAGSCLTDLSANLPESSSLVYGTDLIQARNAGYQDGGTLEELGTSQAQTGALPDALTRLYRYGQLITTEEFTAKTGVDATKIECALNDQQRTVMSGSFSAAEVSNSSVANEGHLAASGDRLGFTSGDADPKKLLEPRDGSGLQSNTAVNQAITSLRDNGSYSIVVQVGNPNAEKRARAAGLGVASGTASGEGRALVVAWVFADANAAKNGRNDIVDRVNLALPGSSAITAGDLQLDGSLVRAKLNTRKAPDLSRILTASTTLIAADG